MTRSGGQGIRSIKPAEVPSCAVRILEADKGTVGTGGGRENVRADPRPVDQISRSLNHVGLAPTPIAHRELNGATGR